MESIVLNEVGSSTSLENGKKRQDVTRKTAASRKMILFVVFLAILLDNVLLTIIVCMIFHNAEKKYSGDIRNQISLPIIPDFFYRQTLQKYIKQQELALQSHRNNMNLETLSNNYYNGRVIEFVNFSALEALEKDIPMRDLRQLYGHFFIQQSHVGISVSQLNRTNKLPRDKTLDHTNINHMLAGKTNRSFDRIKHHILVNQNVKVGIMFASKAMVQLITNPFVGNLTQKIGYEVPMFIGFMIMFVSTLVFAYSQSYWLLLCARAVQGIGSSLSSVSGMSIIADYYPDNEERGSAMGIALSGLALGVLIGPPFGGFMYQFFDKEVPLIILSIIALANGVLQLFVLKPRVYQQPTEGVSLLKLLKDPLILITAGSIMVSNMGIAMLEPSLPIWMMDTMNAAKWELGIAFLPASLSYLIGTSSFGPLGHKFGRWLCACIGMGFIGTCLMMIPNATTLKGLILPNAGLGFSIGMVDSSMMPTMANLVDVRHIAVYGNVYAIADVAFCLGYALGPSMSGTLVKIIHFQGMLYSIAIINFVFAPVLMCLRPFEKEQENRALVDGTETGIKFNELTEKSNKNIN